jgi:hypothetical protein
MKRLITVISVLALAAAPAGATTFVMVSDESLVQQADLIVRARIDRVDPQSTTAAARTEVRALVDEVLKGQDPGETVRLSVLGGRSADGMTLKIWGAPSFREGEEVILFLSQRRDGTYAPLHLFLGAFHEFDAGAVRLAVRGFSEARQITLDGSEPRPEPLRDADRFASWIRARVADPQAAADYLVEDRDRGMRSRVDAFTLLLDEDTNLPIRWRTFNNGGGSVHWRAHSAGEQGLSGGGFTQFQNGLSAWNADGSTPIDYRYDGTTNVTKGLKTYDTLNTILWDDPNNEVGNFNCSSGGVLAIGGPWYDNSVTHVFQGQTYHEALNADIEINKGLSCFFSSSGSPLKAAEEIFTHELGHTLGLGHSCGDGASPSCGSNAAFNDALMRANVHDDGRGGRLGSDDRAGIAKLYGSGSGSPPAAPSGLTGGGLTHTAAQVAWTDNSGNETSFHVEVKEGSGSFTDIGTVPANSIGALLNGLTPGANVSVRVRAQGSGGFSGYSNTISFTLSFSTPLCGTNSTTLCASSNRYKVQMAIRPNGSVSFVNALRVVGANTANSGLFFFPPPADANDWQVLIKVLNGCPINNNWWVFYAATTNVEFTITVTDTQSGRVKTYYNPPNTAAAVTQDTGAFATCP